jgi:hypothetical protein
MLTYRKPGGRMAKALAEPASADDFWEDCGYEPELKPTLSSFLRDSGPACRGPALSQITLRPALLTRNP